MTNPTPGLASETGSETQKCSGGLSPLQLGAATEAMEVKHSDGGIARVIIQSMAPWFKGRSAREVNRRSESQRAWDSAVMACAEYVRRRENYDETLALELHELLSIKLPKL